MKQLKLQVQISVDGFIAGPNGEMDWLAWNATEDFIQYVTELTDSCDTMLLGRKLADGFIPYWTDITTRPKDPQYSFARKMVDMPKIVFSNTLDKSSWDNTQIAKSDSVTEINDLKKQDGKDIVMYGGAEFVTSVIKAGLIDEYHLFVNPAAAGKGMSIFGGLEKPGQLSLIKATPLTNGIVVLCYKPA
ncbi:MAG: dihydrofolate reductase family protein [Bacteroidetes bacterium]|nr:dihydrofolate reductase family protein [Bacteroidota bacterium]